MRLVISLLYLASTYLLACECPPGPSEEQEFEGANAVMLVRVTHAKLQSESQAGKNEVIAAGFEVLEVFKGSATDITEVRGSVARAYKASCDPPLLVGETYILYSHGESTVWLKRCGPSQVYGSEVPTNGLGTVERRFAPPKPRSAP